MKRERISLKCWFYFNKYVCDWYRGWFVSLILQQLTHCNEVYFFAMCQCAVRSNNYVKLQWCTTLKFVKHFRRKLYKSAERRPSIIMKAQFSRSEVHSTKLFRIVCCRQVDEFFIAFLPWFLSAVFVQKLTAVFSCMLLRFYAAFSQFPGASIPTYLDGSDAPPWK